MSSWTKQTHCPSVPCLCSLLCTASLCPSTAPVPHTTTSCPLPAVSLPPFQCPILILGAGAMGQVGIESQLVHVCLEVRSAGISRDVQAPSMPSRHRHQKPSPTLTCLSGQEDVCKGRTEIRETIAFPEASKCYLPPEEMGFCSAWVQPAFWRNGKAEETPGEGTHHPLLRLQPGHISVASPPGPTANPLLVLGFLKASRR